jgi:hypothetical protein
MWKVPYTQISCSTNNGTFSGSNIQTQCHTNFQTFHFFCEFTMCPWTNSKQPIPFISTSNQQPICSTILHIGQVMFHTNLAFSKLIVWILKTCDIKNDNILKFVYVHHLPNNIDVWGLLKEASFFIWPLFVTFFLHTPTFPLFIFLSCLDFGDTNGLKDFLKYKGIYFPFSILQKDP